MFLCTCVVPFNYLILAMFSPASTRSTTIAELNNTDCDGHTPLHRSLISPPSHSEHQRLGSFRWDLGKFLGGVSRPLYNNFTENWLCLYMFRWGNHSSLPLDDVWKVGKNCEFSATGRFLEVLPPPPIAMLVMTTRSRDVVTKAPS